MTIPTTNPMLRHMYEEDLARQQQTPGTITEAEWHKLMDLEAKHWYNEAEKHDELASDHEKKAYHKNSGESKRVHHTRMARGHRKTSHSLRNLAACCHGRELPESEGAATAVAPLDISPENPANR